MIRWRLIGLLASVTGLWALGARAADKPVIAPPAEWVKPSVVSLTPSKATAGAAVGVILEDLQLNFTADTQASYWEFVAKAQTPQGLAALGTLAPAWNPDTDRLIIHKVHIIRDGKVIDVLAAGKTFSVLRRESRLEQATLDGTLTAAMQIEGLQVGDLLDVAWTIERTDPVLKGHIQEDLLLNAPPGAAIDVRAQWPSKAGVAVRGSDWGPALEVKAQNGLTTASMRIDDAPEVILPKGAPARFLRGREVQISNFASWSDVSVLMAPLYEMAARLAPGSPLQAEIARINALSSDPKVRAAAALALVQDDVRYVLLALNGGGLKPASADITWERRFGDCKGKTVLLLALLRGLGVEAEPALVSTAAGDGMETRLPTLAAFDHVLVRARIDGRDYWLDGARTGDRRLDAIRTPPFQWALPIREAGAKLVALERSPLALPEGQVDLHLDASAGVTSPAKANGETVLRGDAANQVRLSLANLTEDQRQQALKAYWSNQYSFIDPKTMSAGFDTASGEEKLTFDGTAKLDWTSNGYEADGANLTGKPDLERRNGPHRDAPYAVNFPSDELRTETIILPHGGKNFTVAGKDIDETVGGMAFSRKAAIRNGVFTLQTRSRSVAAEFPAAGADKVAARLTELSKSAVFVVPPDAAAKAAGPAGFDEAVEAGAKALNCNCHSDALAALDRAVKLNPKSVRAYALRSMAHLGLGEVDAARQDDDAALALDGGNEDALLAKGDLAGHDGRWTVAIVDYTQAADAAPGDYVPRVRRIVAFQEMHDEASALADSDDALKALPHEQHLHQVRGLVLARLKRSEEAIAEAKEIAASDPKDDVLQRSSAEVLWAAGHKAEALAAMDRVVALKPTPANYMTRSQFRDSTDFDGAEVDARAALKLEPMFGSALAGMAWIEQNRRHFAEAKGWYDRLVATQPDKNRFLADRGGVELQLGQTTEAKADFAKVRQLSAAQPESLNALCWSAATNNFELAQALIDCDMAIKLAPRAADILDSRAFVLLRLGRDDDAINQYDAAINLDVGHPSSFYGRSLAERRKGRIADADRDLAAALAIDKGIVDQFKGYGLTR